MSWMKGIEQISQNNLNQYLALLCTEWNPKKELDYV